MFDWAGTTVDHGCMAPVAAFQQVFLQKRVPISLEEARGPMGVHKRTHIQKICQMPSVRERWIAAHGTLPTSHDVDRMFAAFVPLQLSVLSQHAEPIEGCLSTVEALRHRGTKIGATTGFTAEMMAVLLPEARRRGYAPDLTVSASDVPEGRPYLLMESGKCDPTGHPARKRCFANVDVHVTGSGGRQESPRFRVDAFWRKSSDRGGKSPCPRSLSSMKS